jgi:hypothetical protein
VKGQFPKDISHLQLLTKEQLFASTESDEVLDEVHYDNMKKNDRNRASEDDVNGASCVSRKRAIRQQKYRNKKRNEEGSEVCDGDNDETTVVNNNEGNSNNSGSDSVCGYGYGDDSMSVLYVRYPIGVVSHKDSMYACDNKNGKQALTVSNCQDTKYLNSVLVTI